jgi:hypothetical protein
MITQQNDLTMSGTQRYEAVFDLCKAVLLSEKDERHYENEQVRRHTIAISPTPIHWI